MHSKSKNYVSINWKEAEWENISIKMNLNIGTSLGKKKNFPQAVVHLVPSLCHTNQGHLNKHVSIFVANKICNLHCFFVFIWCSFNWLYSIKTKLWFHKLLNLFHFYDFPIFPSNIFNCLWWLVGGKAELLMF